MSEEERIEQDGIEAEIDRALFANVEMGLIERIPNGKYRTTAKGREHVAQLMRDGILERDEKGRPRIPKGPKA